MAVRTPDVEPPLENRLLPRQLERHGRKGKHERNPANNMFASIFIASQPSKRQFTVYRGFMFPCIIFRVDKIIVLGFISFIIHIMSIWFY